MDRTRFYSVEQVGGKDEFDYLKNNISKFTMTYQPLYYRVSEEDLMRPDMISYRNYGTVQYWWLILSVNNVFDPFLELTVGMRLTIPSVLDIFEFYKKYAVR